MRLRWEPSMTKTLLNNRYQVIQVLGAGGFGETFLAEDAHMPSRRRCVIKQLKPITNDPQTYTMIQQRFEREAATLEYLGEASDQIPKLYAYFSENGQFYLVQEWIQGQTLTDLVNTNGPLDENAVKEILQSLLPVLDYVHSKGIIHRDIKPDNIILRNPIAYSSSSHSRGSVGGKPILIDFGAVKETIRSVVNTPGYLTKSLVIGTPGYMPSEQAVGRPVYASDLYSLGLTAIYLLTGKHPHQLQTNLQTGEVLWHNLAPSVSPDFAMVLNQSIKPLASDRYTTASKMLHALQSTTSVPHTLTNTTQATVALSPDFSQLPSSGQRTPVIPASSAQGNWQKPAWIVGSLIVGGLIGAVAIANFNRQPATEAPTATSPIPTYSPEPAPINSEPAKASSTPTFTTTRKRLSAKRSRSLIVPTSAPPQEVTQTPSPNPPVSPESQSDTEPVESETSPSPTASTPPQDNQTPEVPTSEPSSTPTPQNTDETPNNSSSTNNINTNKAVRNNSVKTATTVTSSVKNVPAFPTGTSRSTVEASLGKPNKDLRGAWGNTRAVSYKYVPNKIDLGYLFDRHSGELLQTEVAFAQSVDPQVMQTTLAGMLGGASDSAKQGLQQVQQRRADSVTFTKGSLKGQITRQDCGFIYISIWNEDLHDFVSPSVDKKC